ncbi:MAG TPA: FliM/FliN family flagellar motor switch protein [Planctomycetaceae bacterium]|nr:FliM/FliN family flagellar motor switch protein [Planctomycetaceae bacterium]
MLTEANVEQIINAVSGNAAALTESFAQCFDMPWSLTAGESGPWNPEDGSSDFQGSGLIALFELGGEGAAVLIPETIALPEWYEHPNESQKARLDTLAMEWSMNLFPPDMEPSRFATIKAPRLAYFIEQCQPRDWAAALTLTVTENEGTPIGALLMVWPLAAPRFEVAQTAPPPTPAPAAASAHKAATSPAAKMVPTVDPLSRLRELPVQVSVRLAEKKITVSQLLAIANGSLITFPKSCEALLDLYVNNARYCRGEAVKIGENFGLKINEVGTTEERASKILN